MQATTKVYLGIAGYVALFALACLLALALFGQASAQSCTTLRNSASLGGLPAPDGLTWSKVAPKCSINNFLNAREANAVFGSQHLLCVNEGEKLVSNFNNLFGRQDAIRSNHSASVDHVVNVVLVSTGIDMGRIAARRVVAGVATKKAIRHRAIYQLPCEDVRSLSTGVFGAVFGTSDHKRSISISILIPSPRPAIIGASLLNFLPKSNFDRPALAQIGAVSTTKFSASAVDNGKRNFERAGTELTGKLDYGFSDGGHFKSPKFDLVRGVEAKQRFGISLKTKPLYHASKHSNVKTSNIRTSNFSVNSKRSNSKTSNNSNAFEAAGQTCTPPRWGGWVNSCQGLSIRWLNQNAISQIDHFDVRWHADGKIDRVSGSAISLSRLAGCNFSSHVTITQFMTNGASCSLTSTGSAPHSFPCSLCANSAGLGTTVVSSANFRGSVSRNSLVTFFPDSGVTFTDQQAFATTIPLPTILAGVSVSIDGTLLGLVSVAPGQINAYLPEWLPEGPTEVTAAISTTRGSVPSFVGRPQLNPNAPGIFTAAANGSGQAASVWLVVRPNGTQSYYAPGQLQFSGGDIVVLVIYATGINESQCELFLGNGARYTAQFAGPSGFVGVWQLNYIIPTNQIWQGVLGGYVRVGVAGRSWDSNAVDFRR